MKVEALIFDFDGLVLDTETCEFRAMEMMFSRYHAHLPLTLWEESIGTRRGFDPFTYLENQVGYDIDPEFFQTSYHKILSELIENEVPRPGVEATLKTALTLGLKIGMASNSPRTWIEPNLKRFGLDTYFNCLTTGEEVNAVKPDPALYNLTVRRLNVHHRHVIAFEDSESGLLAAKRAGVSCVVVPNPMTHHFHFLAANLRLYSMADMTLEQIISSLGMTV